MNMRLSKYWRHTLLASSLALVGCSETPQGLGDLHDENPDEYANMGGTMTLDIASGNAFTYRAPTLTDPAATLQHENGRSIYNQNFVPPPAALWYGLGPVYSNSSCKSCHINGGRGKPLEGAEPPEQMLYHISDLVSASDGAPMPVSGFGYVLQTRNTGSVQREGNFYVVYQDISGSYDDGEHYTLRKPTYTVSNPYRSFPPSLQSARVASQLVGLGLLEAIPDEEILANADENDANGDGISGRANIVYNILTFSTSIGRFGSKAISPTIKQQIAFDFNEAMGVTSSLSPYNVEPCHGQPQAVGQELDDPEVQEADAVRPLNVYLRTTAVPKRRNMNDDLVRRGQKLFTDAGCISCHVEKYTTGNISDQPEVNNQTIYPYTDLLLHDMGDGLGDGRREFIATGNEWRTPPLWGIGLTQTVSGAAYFLHDGRARNLYEAILWHGGEAETAKEFFRKLSKQDRDAVIAFLNSL
jgi:CxxC motif-containing protein (DUF1111 family)